MDIGMSLAKLAAPCRREANRINRREAIIDVARASFMKYGYAGTSMSAIAAKLGGSKGTLWNYFSSKDVLFAAVIDHSAKEFRQQFSLILNPDANIRVTLRNFAREFLQKVTLPSSVALHRLVVGEVKRFPETGRIFNDRALAPSRALLADYLAIIMARGKLRQTEPLIAAHHLAAICMAGCHQQLLLGLIDLASPEMIEYDAEQAVTTFLLAHVR